MLPRRRTYGGAVGGCAPVCEGILHRLPWPGSESVQPMRTLGVTSCNPGEGVTTLAAHLAVAAAEHNQGPGIAGGLQSGEAGGGRSFWASSRRPAWRNVSEPSSARPAPSSRPRWPISGCSPAEVSAAVRRESSIRPAWRALVQELSGEYGLVVFDMPSATQASCLAHLAGLLDGVLLVIESERVGVYAADTREGFIERRRGPAGGRRHE